MADWGLPGCSCTLWPARWIPIISMQLLGDLLQFIRTKDWWSPLFVETWVDSFAVAEDNRQD